MKKLLFALIALVALFVATGAQANDVMPNLQDNESVELQFEFQYNSTMDNTIDLYSGRFEADNDDAGKAIPSTKIAEDGTLALGDQGECLRNVNVELSKFYMVVTPYSLFDVSIYTENIPAVADADCDGYVDGTADLTVTPNFPGHRIPYPAPWALKTTLQRAQWIGEKAGIPHMPYKWALLALKIWSQGNTGASFDATETDPDLIYGAFRAPVTVSGEILDVDWAGDLVQFTYIPEKLAVDMDGEATPDALADPIWGSYKKVIAGTMFGTNIYEAQEISIAANLLKTGKGDYEGKLYFDLRTN